MLQMRITSNQLAILDSFSVTRLKEDDSLLDDVGAFENPRNENLVAYLTGDAFDDDNKNRCACYVVRDGDGQILCYFSIKCGLLYSEFEELKKFEPCLDVADAEGAIYERELTDILDVLQEVLREAKSGRRVK